MTSDDDRDLRRLAKKYRIFYKCPVSSEQWPPSHRNTFSNIQKLGESKFETFCSNVDIRLTEEPWREQVKRRAQWLATRAARLRKESRNEAGWRFGLENHVFHRFSVEVACPKCRARIWRSEIEASIDASDEELERRRKNRQPCRCDPDTRRQDYYEIGTNPLFSDRTQEPILYDPLMRSILPKQQPDRIYGLNQTINFEKSLSQTIGDGTDTPQTLRDAVETTPFKRSGEPLLFPFLVVEAKSEKSPNGFDDIQAQTAFPIWALLRLQEGLRASAVGVDLETNPLVWFFANRGDSWRVYGAYIASDGSETKYEIVQLWDGCILSRDSALQLLLIVDYIFDWARDLYRPSVLRQLISLATGRAYDTISLVSDSDIFSMRGYVSDWIPPAPSVMCAEESGLDTKDAIPELDHPSMLKIPIPNTKLGTIRSASLVERQLVGLHITEESVRTMIHIYNRTGKAKEVARKILNFLTANDELLLITEEALNDMEFQWTGIARPPQENSMFFARIMFTTYINVSWDIVQEISYLAISEPAYDVLMAAAQFKRARNDMARQLELARKVGNEVLKDTIGSLQRSPSSRSLMAAISCTVSALFPVPARVRDDYAPPASGLEFKRQTKGGLPWSAGLRDAIWYAYFSLNKQLSKDKESTKTPPIRASSKRGKIEGIFEDDVERPNHNDPYTTLGALVVSAYGVVLVAGLRYGDTDKRHDLCLYFLETTLEIEETTALIVLLEDLLQARSIYQTILHHVMLSPRKSKPPSEPDWMWNLPETYWPWDEEQLVEWIKELQGEPLRSYESDTQHRMKIVREYLEGRKTFVEAQRARKKTRLVDGRVIFEDTQVARIGTQGARADPQVVRTDIQAVRTGTQAVRPNARALHAGAQVLHSGTQFMRTGTQTVRAGTQAARASTQVAPRVGLGDSKVARTDAQAVRASNQAAPRAVHTDARVARTDTQRVRADTQSATQAVRAGAKVARTDTQAASRAVSTATKARTDTQAARASAQATRGNTRVARADVQTAHADTQTAPRVGRVDGKESRTPGFYWNGTRWRTREGAD